MFCRGVELSKEIRVYAELSALPRLAWWDSWPGLGARVQVLQLPTVELSTLMTTLTSVPPMCI